MSTLEDMRPMPGPGSAFIAQPRKFQMLQQAEAPTITHKVNSDITDDGDNLARLLNTMRCVRCTAMFREEDNTDEACTFHPGPSQTFLRNQNHLDKCTFLCCGATQIGTDPILFAPPPCKTGRHVSPEDKATKVAARRSSRSSVGVAKPLVGVAKPATRAFGSGVRK